MMHLFILSALILSGLAVPTCEEVASEVTRESGEKTVYSCADPNPLGSGTSGVAYKIKDQDDDFFVAKVTPFENPSRKISAEKIKKLFRTEVAAILSVRSPFVIKLKMHFLSEHFGYQVIEFANQRTLNHYISTHQVQLKDPKFVLTLIKKLAQGLHDIHEAKWVHGDIKAKNIVMHNDDPKIIDFDMSVPMHALASLRGTPLYLDPRCRTGKCLYDRFIDVYSLGVVIYGIVHTNLFPFYEDTEEALQQKVDEGRFLIGSGTHWAVGFLIWACMSRRAQSRPTPKAIVDFITDLLESPYFHPDIALGYQELDTHFSANLAKMRVSSKNTDHSPLPRVWMQGNAIHFEADLPPAVGELRHRLFPVPKPTQEHQETDETSAQRRSKMTKAQIDQVLREALAKMEKVKEERLRKKALDNPDPVPQAEKLLPQAGEQGRAVDHTPHHQNYQQEDQKGRKNQPAHFARKPADSTARQNQEENEEVRQHKFQRKPDPLMIRHQQILKRLRAERRLSNVNSQSSSGFPSSIVLLLLVAAGFLLAAGRKAQGWLISHHSVSIVSGCEKVVACGALDISNGTYPK